MMEYLGYIGKVEYDDEAEIFHGEVSNIRDVITFQGKSVDELKTAFRESVDDYLAFCASRGEELNKPFSGRLEARISPELHRDLSRAAQLAGKTVEALLEEQIRLALRKETSVTSEPERILKSRVKANRANSPAPRKQKAEAVGKKLKPRST